MNNTPDLKSLEIEVNRIADLIEVPKRIRPKFARNEDVDYVVIRNQQYVLVKVDVFTTSEFVTDSFEEFLYQVFAGITLEMAELATAQHRTPNAEVRRIIWPKQLELMKQISPDWQQRLLTDLLQILEKNPVRDGLGDLARALRA
jgi:hypothetical protein